MEHNLAIKIKEEPIPAITQKALKSMLCERSQTQKTACCMVSFMWNVHDRQIREAERGLVRLPMAGGWVCRRQWGNRHFFVGDKSFLKCDCGNGGTTLWIDWEPSNCSLYEQVRCRQADHSSIRPQTEKAMAPHCSPLAGKSHGQSSLVGCSPRGREESDRTERLHFHFSLSCIGEGNGNPLQCSCLENPRVGEPGGLPSVGSQSRTRLTRLSSSSSKAIKRKDKGRERGGLEELEVWLKGNVLRDRNRVCIFSAPEYTTDKQIMMCKNNGKNVKW